MSREKQIEETAELERLLRIRRMDIEKQGCDIWALIKKTESEEQSIADYLIGQGYRKASDVAREIIKEVKDHIRFDVGFSSFIERDMFSDYLVELEKKYTEEGK